MQVCALANSRTGAIGQLMANYYSDCVWIYILGTPDERERKTQGGSDETRYLYSRSSIQSAGLRNVLDPHGKAR